MADRKKAPEGAGCLFGAFRGIKPLILFQRFCEKKFDREINLAKKAAIAFSFLAFISGIMLSSALAASSLKIGVMLPLTGRQANFGRIQQKSVLMAAAEVNAGGGINGKKIELIEANTQGNPDVGRRAIEKLIKRDKVIVIGGGFSSTVTWAAISIAQANKIPFLVNSAAADKITEQSWKYIFRLNPPVSERLDAVVSFVSTVATNIRTVALVHSNSFKDAADARRFFKKAGELGLKPVIREGFEASTTDFRPLLTRVKAKKPDLIYAAVDNAKGAALLVRQSRDLKLNPKLFVGGGNGFVQPEFAAHAGKASDHIVCTAIWTPTVSHRGAGPFNEKFIARYKTPPEHYGAEAYAGITVIADALKRTKVLAPGNVRDALAKTNLMTVLGPVKFISYNNKSQQNKLPAFLVQWLNGQPQVVWPKHLATKKAIYPIPK
jgi:branched-chain amino acid transport system substrate-binding protein